MNDSLDPTPSAMILLGRGGYSSTPQAYLQKLVVPVQAAALAEQVCHAFIDQGEPSLPAALQSCAVAGARCILIQPVYLPGDRNLHRWIGKVVMRWHAQWGGPSVELLLAESLGEQPELGTALIALLQSASQTAYNVLGAPPENWAQDPAGWNEVPDHRAHLFFCRGPRCTAVGAYGLAHHLRERLKAYKLLQGDRVLLAQSGCLYPCNQGPLMVVYPDGVWYGKLDEAAIERIVEDHLLDHQIVEEQIIYRFPSESNPTT